MKAKGLIAFKSKLFKPCKQVLKLFKFRLKRSVSIRAFRFRRHHSRIGNNTHKKKKISGLLSVFRRSSAQSEEMDEVGELRSVTEPERDQLLYPSPLTPAYVRASVTKKRDVTGQDDIEDACRSFENYLVEMIVEEGKVRDLMDVEELLYCWKNLRCPVFTNLVCRFYGELCRDLFSGEDGEDVEDSK